MRVVKHNVSRLATDRAAPAQAGSRPRPAAAASAARAPRTPLYPYTAISKTEALKR